MENTVISFNRSENSWLVFPLKKEKSFCIFFLEKVKYQHISTVGNTEHIILINQMSKPETFAFPDHWSNVGAERVGFSDRHLETLWVHMSSGNFGLICVHLRGMSVSIWDGWRGFTNILEGFFFFFSEWRQFYHALSWTPTSISPILPHYHLVYKHCQALAPIFELRLLYGYCR